MFDPEGNGENGDVMEVRLLRSGIPVPFILTSPWSLETPKSEGGGHGQGRYRYAEDGVGLQVEPPRIPAGRDR
jgi:hypothetical protein